MKKDDSSLRYYLQPLTRYLTLEGVTEIVINRECEVFTEVNGQWQCDKNDELTFSFLSSLCRAIAAYSDNDFGDHAPILSAQLPDGERIQCVCAPVVKAGQLSLTIRKPSTYVLSLADFEQQGFFDYVPYDADFFRRAILEKKTIVIAGGTGSGKTTFDRALMEIIPLDERLITIEDVSELISSHANQINLFYPSEAKQGDLITAASLLKSCLRMKPDRILLAELRGAEAFDFINVASSGHRGSLTTCHADNCAMTFERLAMMIMQNPAAQTLSYEVIQRLLHDVIDIVVHVDNEKVGKNGQPAKGRHITEIWVKKNEK